MVVVKRPASPDYGTEVDADEKVNVPTPNARQDVTQHNVRTVLAVESRCGDHRTRCSLFRVLFSLTIFVKSCLRTREIAAWLPASGLPRFASKIWT